MNPLPIMKKVGEVVSSLTKSILTKLSESGIIVSSTTSKIITMLVIAAIAYIILHFVGSLKTVTKVAIYILSALLIISIGASFFP